MKDVVPTKWRLSLHFIANEKELPIRDLNLSPNVVLDPPSTKDGGINELGPSV